MEKCSFDDAVSWKVKTGEIDLLRALLKSPDGTATIDDATDDLTVEFRDGGKWRGLICLSLAKAGLIRRVDVVSSKRPSRHSGYVAKWRLVNRHKAALFLSRLAAAIEVRQLSAAEVGINQTRSPTDQSSNIAVQSTFSEFAKQLK